MEKSEENIKTGPELVKLNFFEKHVIPIFEKFISYIEKLFQLIGTILLSVFVVVWILSNILASIIGLYFFFKLLSLFFL